MITVNLSRVCFLETPIDIDLLIILLFHLVTEDGGTFGFFKHTVFLCIILFHMQNFCYMDYEPVTELNE